MCGIGGIMMYPKQRSQQELEYIKELVAELALENESRGTHATGVATFGEEGFEVFKNAISASEITKLDSWHSFLDKNITNKTQNILIHTRYATQGLASNNDNNHPIEASKNIGVHNGMIYNDVQLFKTEGLYQKAEVDSEVIFRLIDKQLGNEIENSKAVAEKLSGSYAVAFVNKEESNKLNYFRNDNPTTFAHIPQLNITIFASLDTYVRKAIESTNITCEYMYEYAVDTMGIEYMTPKQDVVMQFDVNENAPSQQLNQVPVTFKDNYEGFYGGGWYSDYYGDNYNYSDAYSDDSTSYDAEVEGDSVYDFLEKKSMQHLMSEEDYATLIELLNLNETNEWSKGYKAGRTSLESETKIRKDDVNDAYKNNQLTDVI